MGLGQRWASGRGQDTVQYALCKDRPGAGAAGVQGSRPGLMRAAWTSIEQRGWAMGGGGESDMAADGQVCGGWQLGFQLGQVDGLRVPYCSAGTEPGSAGMTHSI